MTNINLTATSVHSNAASSTTDEKAAQLRRFRDTYIPFQSAMEALNILRDHHKNGCHQTTAQCILLMGNSGVGKTKLLEKYMELANAHPLPTIIEDGMEIDPLPILRVDVPSRIFGKALVEEMLTVIGDPSPSKGTLSAMTMRLKNWIKLRRVSLIILDEVQHLTDRSRCSKKFAYEVGDWIKNLLNSALCPVILSGTSDAEVIVTHNEQLSRRCAGIIRLEPFSFSTKSERARFRALLMKFEEALGLPEPSGLSEADLAQRIHAATRGHLGHVNRLLDVSLRAALNNGLTKLDKALLGDVHARFGQWNGAKENPFFTPTAPLYRSAQDKSAAQIAEQNEKRQQLQNAA